MSGVDHDDGAPIAPGSPLARVLDDFAVPALPAGFADRVLAAAEARPSPLPELRRSGGGGGRGQGRGWRLGRRMAIGAIGFGALATAAAATGLLDRFDLPAVPSPEKVWASITGKEAAPVPAAAPVVPPPADPEPAALAPVRIEGRIDTPEELGEAFRRIDEVRQGRVEARRQIIDSRIESEIERRRAAGLPLPTPEEEARVRQRIEDARTRREGLVAERIEARREELLQRVESGEGLTREDIARPLRDDARALERAGRLERLRRMTPQQRREALRQLPADERRELIEAWRQRRAGRLDGETAATASTPAPERPEASPAPEPQTSQFGTPGDPSAAAAPL
ncbi:hypothetical protein [Erythrobacter sp.]|uniref:hypothetical protein n=1 Tax=Erythrobacter sp. TaxID=1042 RepID=UPI0025E56074|nr:hypothetical protein [Erythrobacter sp.]